MAEGNQEVFPKIRVVTPRVLCECIGAAVTRVVQLGRVTEPCLSEHNRGATVSLDDALDNQEPFPKGFGF